MNDDVNSILWRNVPVAKLVILVQNGITQPIGLQHLA
jgi:hypothetical protein